MRLDIFLRSSRLIVRRTLAQEFCDAGLIEVNGAAARSSKDVRAGDLITIKRRNRILKVKVAALPEKKQVSREQAAELFDIVSDEVVSEDLV